MVFKEIVDEWVLGTHVVSKGLYLHVCACTCSCNYLSIGSACNGTTDAHIQKVIENGNKQVRKSATQCFAQS